MKSLVSGGLLSNCSVVIINNSILFFVLNAISYFMYQSYGMNTIIQNVITCSNIKLCLFKGLINGGSARLQWMVQ